MAGFIFGAGTPYTYEDLQKQRAIAERLAEATAAGSNARTVPEGLMNLGTGIMAGLMKRRADKTAAKGKSDYDSRFNSITQSLLGGGKKSGSPSTVSASAPADVVSGIQATAESLGIDPVDLATAISYETAGTFDPMKAGPTTKWGQHKGLIQFGEPQAAKYGVDWNNPVGSQLGPDGAVARYLKDTGVKPGMGLLDIYSAINAGGVGRYNRSDAHAGGAPGTVADKVRDQMAGHRAKAMALMGGGASPAMASAPQSAPIGNGMQIMPVSAPAEPQIMPASAPAMGGPMTAFQRAQMASLENEVGVPRQQMEARRAAIMGQQGGNAPSGGGFFTNILPTGAPPEQMAQVQEAETALEAMPIEQIAELANSPFAEDWQRNLMQKYLEHRMEQQFAPPPDPLEQRRKELELQKLEQDVQPKPQGRPATAEEKRAFGLPDSAPVFIKPDGTPELLDVSKINPQQGYRPASPQEKQQFGVAPDAPLVIGPDNKPSILRDGQEQGPQMSMTLPDGTVVAMGGSGQSGGSLPGEMGSRIGLGQRFLEADLPHVLPIIEGGGATGPIDFVQGYFGRGESGEVQRRMKTGVDALRRNLTGAGMAVSEASEYARRYEPQITDDAATLKKKALGLKADLEAVRDGAIAGRTGNMQLLLPGSKLFQDRHARPDAPQAPQGQQSSTAPMPEPQTGGYDLGIDQIPENVQVEGEDGNVYMRRNGKLWRKSPNNDWEAVQ